MIENLGTPAVVMLIGALISAAGAILAAQQQAISEKELRQKSDEIAELNRQIASSITGGDSFAYIVPMFLDNSIVLSVIHQGKHPLYDLDVRIVDLFRFEKMVKQNYSWSDMQRDEIHIRIGNIAPGQANMLQPIQVHAEPIRWNIFFSARNGFFDELLRVRRVGNEWKTAVRVSNNPTPGERKTLFEKVDQGYPVGDDGQVMWE